MRPPAHLTVPVTPRGPRGALLTVLLSLALAGCPGAERLQRSDHQPAPGSGVFLDDVSRLNRTRVLEVVRLARVRELQNLVARAHREGLKIAIAGRRHSQGGHVVYPDALVLDMTAFKSVRAIDAERKMITVESGATSSLV